MKRRGLSIYARTLLNISAAIFAVFLILALVYGTVYNVSTSNQRQEELRRYAQELAILTERRMDVAHTTFVTGDITGYISFATRSTGAYVWVVNSENEIIYNTGIPSDTIGKLERSGDGVRADFILPEVARNTGHVAYCHRGSQTGFYHLLPNPTIWLVASAPIGTRGDLYTGEVILLRRHSPDTFSAWLVDNNVHISFALAYIVSLAIIIWLSRNITNPISVLAKTADSVYRGDLTARVQLGKDRKTLTLPDHDSDRSAESVMREDDLTRLVRTFNTLIAKFEMRENEHREFLGNVSHDLRTPVTSISGFIEGMRDGTISQDKFEYYLDIIKAEADRLEELINTLFEQTDQMESQELKQTVFNLHEWINRVQISFEPMLREKKIHLLLNLDKSVKGELKTIGDVGQLTRVLNNVVSNAIRFAPRGGLVTISTKAEERYVCVIVEDNGPGIGERDIPYVFDRFYKADKSRGQEGSGLGLYIARALINRHGQTIEAGSSLELGGAKITFTIARP
ncbi:MAG TPA: HAMP domain-containing sensor histidine kinase [Bacillota bacterium]|nr:HAMP domain-containing histidine kinase [Clostridia bacterium]MBP6950096.1 HAMP domain-containing histidine kinase [Clostridia bacterium]NMA35504.1 HAMP domain-containing histidine kinase [Clostridiaceae bacterium]HPY64369.1 HAMP domain-containing sensor histidine kinase [Bacillota bacterium]HQC48759.1 HAMP domain-containing sensor histidine kinase [Bacillota bacterium]